MTHKTQKGFAALEGVLILIILAVISGTGWYAVHTKHQTDKILAQSEKTSQNTPITSNKSSAPTTNPSSASTSGQQYLNIPEWRIKLKLGDASKLSFEVNNTKGGEFYTGNYDGYAVPSFKKEFLVDKSCSPGVSLYRAGNIPGDFKTNKVGDYYYWVTGGPGACSDDSDNQLKTNFLRDFSNLDNIEQL